MRYSRHTTYGLRFLNTPVSAMRGIFVALGALASVALAESFQHEEAALAIKELEHRQAECTPWTSTVSVTCT